MKKVRFLLLATLVAMFASCQKEVVEQGAGDNRPTPTGDTRITIEGEGMTGPATRSSDGKVEFEGGYATGAGLYSGDAKPTVAAYPDPGYEVNYFYGGPENEPQKYDYAQNSTSEFEVDLGGQDHKFRCGFKEKKRELTVNAGTGGSVSPSGTNSYRVEKAISITATPNGGYEFAGWTVTSGDATIENPNSSSTTVTLHKSNSTITANFKKNVQFIAVGTGGWILTPSGEAKQVYILDWNSLAYGNGKYVAIGNDQVTTSSDGENWTTPVRPVPWGANYSWNWKKVTYVNGKFVVIGNCSSHSAQKPAVMTSIDGVNWSTPLTFGEYSSEIDKFEDIVYGNGKFVIAGRFGFTTTSVDGINWTEIKSVGNSY
ncbi:InlB B-repeat-containing protein, partial [Bacteroides fragilis]|uniref:InlB B-repeat-containing protein n=1 Tax=Bacteroides fragilis TaxID=817 RepID=UPI0038D45B1D